MATITIQLGNKIIEKLKTLGKKGESYDDIIQRLIEKANYEVFMREQYKILDEEDEWIPIADNIKIIQMSHRGKGYKWI